MAMSSITAMLGPTNTGKTHHAIERMLEHKDGMIGLPLRLLAREVYDRLTARVGESRVALITGEEQRVPARPSYWVATTEAMPVEREVDFVAIDEIQLAAHPQRGHVFTSRLLHARGKLETWFLGADTMRGILQELVPTARVVEHPRLSRLAHAGAVPLSRIPPRSAVVAFSMPHVYEIADRIRRRRGGAAVVLGALSPRTRNAQVAMFQSGEVDCIVATDAIGMGLNLDVEHVAFAATRKFDGHDVRDVDDAELGQIAGRAGRWIHDGTFGTLTAGRAAQRRRPRDRDASVPAHSVACSGARRTLISRRSPHFARSSPSHRDAESSVTQRARTTRRASCASPIAPTCSSASVGIPRRCVSSGTCAPCRTSAS